MAALAGYPSDISLPDSARYYNFIETTKKLNSNYDITWSFQYKLPSTSITNNLSSQVGFTTFLTNLSSPLSSLPGQYLGDQDPEAVLSAHALLTEVPEVLKTEDGSSILLEDAMLSGMLVKIAFDSSGLYALSGRDDRPGIHRNRVKRESLIIRDFAHNLVVNTPLSTISTSFSTLSTDTFRTLRFRYVNLGRTLHIDFRDTGTTTYAVLTSINLGYRLTNVSNLNNIMCGFSFSTPISTHQATAAPQFSAGNFFLKNFHVEGFVGGEVLTETVTSAEIPVLSTTTYTTVTGISAIK